MRNILISIKPEWVEKILNGEKTIEIRKSIPKCKLPCKVYVYCTKDRNNVCVVKQNTSFIYKTINIDCVHILGNGYIGNGKVVAEFILKHFNKFDYDGLVFYEMKDLMLKQSCLTDLELKKYAKNKICYAWHIKSLKIYDNPKELSEFKVYDKTYDNVGAFGWAFDEKEKYHSLTRAPQSWCYVEGEEV